MKRLSFILIILILVLLAYIFIEINMQYGERSTSGICSMIIVYILAFEASGLMLEPIKKYIDF